MPTVTIKKELLLQNLRSLLNINYLDDLFFTFGLEVERYEEINGYGKKQEWFKIEVPANRYDLLCLEGICTALLVYMGKCEMPMYNLIKPNFITRFYVKEETSEIRPYIVASILRDISLTQDIYNSFIDLQDKLHQNIGRKRTIVAIGTHDIDRLEGPFTYITKQPNEISFVPLNDDKVRTASELMQIYSKDSHLKQYVPILRGKSRYPIIFDKNGVILSLPPIINGEHSKITLNTKNILIECTATDKHKANIVLDTMVCMFSKYCKQSYSIEPVEICYYNNEIAVTPELHYRQKTINFMKAFQKIGIYSRFEQIENIVTKMSYKVISKCDENITVSIPPTRHDVIHDCDISEDIAIGYGYENIAKTLPKTNIIATQVKLNKISNQLRHQLACMGFTEALSFSLCSLDDITYKLRRDSDHNAVTIANPRAIDFQAVRTSLLPGLLRTVAYNRNMPLPLHLFEISDVVIKERSKEVGAINERHLAAVNYNKSSGFELMHGVLDRIMQLLNIENTNGYLHPCEKSMFFHGRSASIVINGKEIGHLGILHPEVITAFDLNQSCAALEMNIELLIK